MRRLRLWVLVALAALAAGCATQRGPFHAHLESESVPVRGCAEWYRALDDLIDQGGVRDAQYRRMEDFPYLRVDRFNASLRDRAATGTTALHAFAERLFELESESRRLEIENLPRDRLAALPGADQDLTRAAVLRQTLECARLLRELDLAKPQARRALLQEARVPDDYSTAARVFGLYPLTRLPFHAGVRRWEHSVLAAFQGAPEGEPPLNLVRYAPPLFPPLPRRAVAAILAHAELDPLGVPVLSPRELARMAAAYAPSFEVAITGDHDRFGELRWPRGADAPEVNAAEPVVYVHAAYTRYGDRVLLQLVYSLWFPERPLQGEVDLLAGKLDGVIWRVTLAPDGEPLIYDAIHACGCYHMFFPTPRAAARPAPAALEEWAFVPQQLPRVREDERPVVRIASRTHYVERVSVVRGADSVVRYPFRAYEELRALRLLEGGSRSAFGPDGLVAGSERAERFFFWPMGVASAGTMRQWGRHATAFVGRRHFDDADLLERRFALDVGAREP